MAKERVISGIDIGSSKIATVIAQVSSEEQVSIIGVSSVLSRGIKKGVVVDIDDAVGAISESLEAAERMAGYAVSSAFIIVDGSHVSSVNSSGVVAVASPEGEITSDDVERVTEAARAISIPSSREIIHVVPRSFIVDAQEGVHDPVGMSGVRLQVETHIISGAATSMRNLVKCVNQVGVDVENLVFSGLVASESVLSETEKELGVVLVDIGGGTIDFVLFVDGSPAYSAVLPIGGKNITNDIAIGLRVSLEDAEKIKKYVSDYKPPTLPDEPEKKGKRDKDEEVRDELDISELGIVGLTTVDKKFLKDGVIKPRLEEIFDMIEKEIKKSGFEGRTPSGMVVCGGTAQTVGVIEVGKKLLRMPLRIGNPTGASGLIEEVASPAYASTIGLVIYGSKTFQHRRKISIVQNLPKVKNYAKKAVDWIKSFLP